MNVVLKYKLIHKFIALFGGLISISIIPIIVCVVELVETKGDPEYIFPLCMFVVLGGVSAWACNRLTSLDVDIYLKDSAYRFVSDRELIRDMIRKRNDNKEGS